MLVEYAVKRLECLAKGFNISAFSFLRAPSSTSSQDKTFDGGLSGETERMIGLVGNRNDRLRADGSRKRA